MKIQTSICFDDWGKPRKTLVRLFGTGIWTRDLPNASLVHSHGATSWKSCFSLWSMETMIYIISLNDHLFGIVVNTSDCHPRGSGFDSRLYPRHFYGSIGSGTGSTQPREDNWVATWMRSSEIGLRNLKLKLRDKRFANHKAPWTVIWPATASVGLGSSGL